MSFRFSTLLTVKAVYYSGKVVDDALTVKEGGHDPEVEGSDSTLNQVMADFEAGLVKSMTMGMVNLSEPS